LFENKEQLISIVREASDAILNVYNSDDFNVELKDDNSPLTRADRASHTIIVKRLTDLDPSIPVLSEESEHIEYEERSRWEKFWLVDPLDGTKEFIKKNGEFTVNIALIENGLPIFGIIMAPVTNTIWYGGKRHGAFVIEKNSEPRRIETNTDFSGNIVAAMSRSHSSEAETQLFTKFGVSKQTGAGSSLKFCLIAEGKAHLYYRANPTFEWDTGAGQAIVEAAGGFFSFVKGKAKYNDKSLLNPGFIVAAAAPDRLPEEKAKIIKNML
jgi:3'(2'), 5'-bisphosphate nucleotidase